ncbi:CsgG/HfaB family protein [Acidocella sp. C78]|uniref:CsgG/HfaB family protein n=1 Tax=Acidocella sp. C78 TaxID=1671486 RepID=UPI00191BA0F4|nr:CsgG/HfaB family protein [Acidocella sp. C78]
MTQTTENRLLPLPRNLVALATSPRCLIRRVSRARMLRGTAVLLLSSQALVGCASIGMQRVEPGEAPIVLGPKVRYNLTPVDPAFACLADEIVRDDKPRLTFAVGDIKDYTGRYNINEGNAITQGGALMVETALGHLGNAITQVERVDPHITQMELGYTDQRELGDGRPHQLKPGAGPVPWMPYYGGTILRSQYYIIGGITELNYNIQSGGVQVMQNLSGPSATTFTENIAIDLELVDTQTTQIVKTVSLEKQIVGYQVSAGIFRFFGSDLWDVNIGAKNEEPLELGVRTTLEQGTLDLVAAAEHLSPLPCMKKVRDRISEKTADQLRKTPNHVKIIQPPMPPGAEQPLARPLARPLAGASGGAMIKLAFDFGSSEIPPGDGGLLTKIAQMAAKAPITVELLAPALEDWSPMNRYGFVQARIAALKSGLATHGMAAPVVTTQWAPSDTDSKIYHEGSSYQKVAIVTINK